MARANEGSDDVQSGGKTGGRRATGGESSRSRLPLAIGFSLLTLLIVAATRLAFDDWTTAGAFGDYVGVIGTLANSAALLIALAELRLQRQESSASRTAQQEQAKAQADLVHAIRDAAHVLGVVSMAQAEGLAVQRKDQQTQVELLRAQKELADLTLISAYAETASRLSIDPNISLGWLEGKLIERGHIVPKR